MEHYCEYCINKPNKATFIIENDLRDHYICKKCLKKTYVRQLIGEKTVRALRSSLRVNRYNLPLDHKYSIESFEYLGGLSNGGGTTCDNCNAIITNIAHIKRDDGKQFTVGCDCAQTLSMVDANDFWKIKERESLHRKIMGWVRNVKKDIEKNGKIYTPEDEGDGVFIRRHSMAAYRVTRQVYDQYFKSVIEA